jgi:hypothetical protein
VRFRLGNTHSSSDRAHCVHVGGFLSHLILRWRQFAQLNGLAAEAAAAAAAAEIDAAELDLFGAAGVADEELIAVVRSLEGSETSLSRNGHWATGSLRPGRKVESRCEMGCDIVSDDERK